MSKQVLNVHIPTEDIHYPIIIGQNLIENLATIFNLEKYSKIVILTDQTIAKLWLNPLQSSISKPITTIILPNGEKSKNIEQVEFIWQNLQENHIDRKSLFINLGGGVISDIGGFAASTFLRGIDFINIPTTLLSQVDASVGGKNGINFHGLKNYIGTFTQPVAVIVDTDTLESLPMNTFVEGFGEIVKHALISDRTEFEKLEKSTLEQFNKTEIQKIIYKSCQIKTEIINSDPKETLLQRKLLNFGHTIGHALESLSLQLASEQNTKALLHGEAVSIGMVAESKLSELIGNLDHTDMQRIEKCLKNLTLPTRFESSLAKDEVIKQIQKLILTDKKNDNGKIRWVLLESIGNAIADIQVEEELIVKAIEYIV